MTLPGMLMIYSGLTQTRGCKKCFVYLCRLSGCMVTEEGCCYLYSALRSNPSHLKELDVSYNNPGYSGIKLLSDLLNDLHCKLDNLKYVGH